MLNFDWGVRVLSFRKKRKNQRKVFRLRPFLRRVCWVQAFLEGLFLGDVLLLPFAAGAALEPAAFAYFWALRSPCGYYLLRFGIPRMGGVLAEQLFTRAMFTAAAAQSILGGTCSRSTIY